MNEKLPTQFGLFAGQGGFELAYHSEGFECVGISEICPDANVVTRHWFGVENFGDIRAPDFVRRILESCPPIDVLTGGVPCQPASLLGKRLGQSDERWLWDRTIEIVDGLRPTFAHFENPAAILTVGGGRAWNGIVRGLAEIGYDCWWQPVPAAIFGAGHLRERLFLIAAHTDRRGWRAGRTRGHAGTAEVATEQTLLVGDTDTSCRRRPARAGLCESESRRQRSGRSGDIHRAADASHAAHPRLQGHAGLHAEPDTPNRTRRKRAETAREDTLPRRIYEEGSTATLGGMKQTREFRCWLMGFPPDWLKPLADSPEMQSSRKPSNPSPAPSE